MQWIEAPLGFVKKNMRERLRNPATRSQARGELLLGNSIIIFNYSCRFRTILLVDII